MVDGDTFMGLEERRGGCVVGVWVGVWLIWVGRKIKSVIEKVDCYDIVLKSDFKIFLVK